ncbi:MAG TPA: Cna B-type domain-containing protein [Candidatus Mediterraneibacter caccogallinarum]|nr:Cna B-type domain-containing protein [Candidatus Mediterraneibacter caccogallinarum]
MKSNRTRLLRQAGSVMAALLFCVMLLQQTVFAADPEQTGSIRLNYSAVDNAEFKVYRAGEITDNWEFVLTGAFQDIPADLNDLDTEAMTELSETLAAYAAADGIEPDYSGRTDENGQVVFEGLTKGLYLIIGESVIWDGMRYDPVPFLLTVPSQDAEGAWNYQTEADVKYETSVPEKEETEYKVVKYWVGDGSGNARPVQITVDILRDGILYDTQTLTAENNWSYSWTAEDNGSVWQVVEREIPDHYTVKVEKNKTMFLLTNTYAGDTPEEVPKTGDSSVPLLPVTLLSLSGMVLILAGLAVRGRREKDDE